MLDILDSAIESMHQGFTGRFAPERVFDLRQPGEEARLRQATLRGGELVISAQGRKYPVIFHGVPEPGNFGHCSTWIATESADQQVPLPWAADL